MPDWARVIMGAQELGDHPSEYVRPSIPNRVWMEWALILSEARGLAQEMVNNENRGDGPAKRPIGS